MIPFLSQQIYKRAMDKWGYALQAEACVEECAELIVALKHLKRDKVDGDDVREEIADVWIMVEQMAMYFGQDQVLAVKNKKLCRLSELLENA